MQKCWSCSLVPGLPVPQLLSLAVRKWWEALFMLQATIAVVQGYRYKGTRLQVMHERSRICQFAHAKLVTFEKKKLSFLMRPGLRNLPRPYGVFPKLEGRGVAWETVNKHLPWKSLDVLSLSKSHHAISIPCQPIAYLVPSYIATPLHLGLQYGREVQSASERLWLWRQEYSQPNQKKGSLAWTHSMKNHSIVYIFHSSQLSVHWI